MKLARPTKSYLRKMSYRINFSEIKNHTTVHLGGRGSAAGGGWGRDHFPKDDIVFTDHFQKDDI